MFIPSLVYLSIDLAVPPKGFCNTLSQVFDSNVRASRKFKGQGQSGSWDISDPRFKSKWMKKQLGMRSVNMLRGPPLEPQKRNKRNSVN